MEYAWVVGIDADVDVDSGIADYQLSLTHWIYGDIQTVPFEDAFQVNVWECSANSGKAISDAEWYAEQANKVIIIKGMIPQIDINSRINFSIRNDGQSFTTDWVILDSIP